MTEKKEKIIVGRNVSPMLVGKRAFLFTEGQVVATSVIEKIETLNAGAFKLETKNSVYFLIISGEAVPEYARRQVREFNQNF